MTTHRKVIVHIATSADGYIAGPDGDLEWLTSRPAPDGFYGMNTFMKSIDTTVLGRKTYEIFAGYWPYAPADDPIAVRLNEAPKYVASRTLDSLGWKNSTLIKGDIAEEVARLKEKYNEIHTSGSGNLAQSLMQQSLVDQYYIWVYPVLLGSGKRLFGDGTVPTALRLVESRTFGNGAVLLSYEPTGKPEYGTTALGG